VPALWPIGDANGTETINDAIDDTRLIHKAIAILQAWLEFPFRTRNKIVELAQQFVDGVLGYEEQSTNDDTGLIDKAIAIL